MAVKRTREPDESELAFAKLAETLSKDPRVDPPEMARAQGFGSKGLKVARKLFAFRSSAGTLVVKLPSDRVDVLASSGQGKRFDPGHGRLMKEWIAIDLGSMPLWPRFAREALEFAAGNATPEATRRRRTTKRPKRAPRRR